MSSNQVLATSIAGFPALVTTNESTRPPLLFIHGAFVTHEGFAPWMEALAEKGWRSIAPSRRGRLGLGPAQARGLTTADYVEDTQAVISALGETPILVGHSLGGLIAQKIAESGKARALALLAPAPAAMLTAQAVALPAYLPMFPRILAGQPIVPSCAGCSRIALNRVPEAERPALHATLVHESGKVYRELIFGSIKVDPAKVKCPVLVVGGAEDRIVSTTLMRWTAERYGAELKLYADHAHWLIGEPGWQTIAADLAAWLDRAVPANLASLTTKHQAA
jgi:pimeloyl-ACP methyl ester carboxylesterase